MLVRLRVLFALTGVLALVIAPSAGAHPADPHYDSILRGITPPVPGLKVAVLARGDRLALTNQTGKVVEVPGYRNEPYLRLLPDGTVQQNLRSQATYSNQDPTGTTPVPASADATGPDSPPKWQTLDRSSRVEFHDHRIHWMGPKGKPAPSVKDPSKRAKAFDWKVPIRVGGKPATISGTLWWTPEEGSVPVVAIGGLVVVVVLGVGFVVVVRRRRGASPTPTPTEDVW